ncbi:N-acetylmuramoyl-L-alanine amidase [Thiorhodococcus mannitoliphagus]|uniref:N-acetylmuramoyl-L-alanine amidase n=1 Tax=Thiorhodococcus mannitoliphagus TaxID=329406 RepID=A0A6P1DNZ7_9GAMM|nr:peptidoglycan recognition family protein [Thiorhodococcus mannitoliphagus]NEX19659.1 N-acetylmuramoyl-L-alanine amidase [Thiorhodococcus mannitoliphagus]
MSNLRLSAPLAALFAVFAWTSAEAREIDLIVIHATGGPGCKQGKLWHAPGGTLTSIRRYFAKNPNIGYHYLIGRDGTIVAGTPESRIAHHARGHNKGSIGIELVNDGDGRDPFPEAQIDALIGLLKRLDRTYDISPSQVKGHSELDNRSFECGGRRYKQKIDPGGAFPGSAGNFPWSRVRDALR